MEMSASYNTLVFPKVLRELADMWTGSNRKHPLTMCLFCTPADLFQRYANKDIRI